MSRVHGRPVLALGSVLQLALLVAAAIALAVSDVDAWSSRFDGLFGLATVGQLGVLFVVHSAWPGRRTGFATAACVVTALGLTLRVVAAAIDLATGRDPVALIVSSFAPMFGGLFLVGIAMLRATGRGDRRSWVPVGMAVIGLAVGNLHQVSHRLDFTLSGSVWAVLWIVLAMATASRLTDQPEAVTPDRSRALAS